MQRIILDTNVIISSLIQRGYPFLIGTELVIEEKVRLLISQELLDEYYEVLNRKRFAKYPEFLNKSHILLSYIERYYEKVTPRIKLNLISDQDDNKLLELADTANTNYLVTGNTNDFTMPKYKTTLIVTPRQYWEEYRP